MDMTSYQKQFKDSGRTLRKPAVKKVTINDIANAAGISKATVSYVINNSQGGFKVSRETAMRVLQTARKLGYRPDEAAVRLAECRKVPLRLLVLSPWLYAQFSDFMARLNSVLQKHEKNSALKITYASYSLGELNSILRPSLLKKYDAVLVAGTSDKDDKFLAANAGSLHKVVVMNRRVEGILCCSVSIDNVTEKLAETVDFSHYDRALILSSVSRNSGELEKCLSFQRACRNSGLPCEFRDMFIRNYWQIWDVLGDELKKNSVATLCFIPRNPEASIVLKHAVENGIDIPGRLGIITADRNLLLDRFVTPALTVIDPCLEEVVEAALELIYGLHEDKKQRSRILKAGFFPGDTVMKKSCVDINR